MVTSKHVPTLMKVACRKPSQCCSCIGSLQHFNLSVGRFVYSTQLNLDQCKLGRFQTRCSFLITEGRQKPALYPLWEVASRDRNAYPTTTCCTCFKKHVQVQAIAAIKSLQQPARLLTLRWRQPQSHLLVALVVDLLYLITSSEAWQFLPANKRSKIKKAIAFIVYRTS